MVVDDRGLLWLIRQPGKELDMNTGYQPVPAGMNQQQLIQAMTTSRLEHGDTVVLIDASTPLQLPGESGPLLFDPTLFDEGGPTIYTATVHQALAALIRSSDAGPVVNIARTVDTEKPFGLVAISQFDETVIITASIIDDTGTPQYGAEELRDVYVATATATTVIDRLSQLVPVLLPGTRRNDHTSGIVVVHESDSRRLTARMAPLLRMQFATASFGMSLLVSPSATLHGGIVIADKHAA
jgi:hypothetical protein